MEDAYAYEIQKMREIVAYIINTRRFAHCSGTMYEWHKGNIIIGSFAFPTCESEIICTVVSRPFMKLPGAPIVIYFDTTNISASWFANSKFSYTAQKYLQHLHEQNPAFLSHECHMFSGSLICKLISIFSN